MPQPNLWGTQRSAISGSDIIPAWGADNKPYRYTIGTLLGDVTAQANAATTAAANAIPVAQKSTPNGVASLDSTGRIPSDQMPANIGGSGLTWQSQTILLPPPAPNTLTPYTIVNGEYYQRWQAAFAGSHATTTLDTPLLIDNPYRYAISIEWDWIDAVASDMLYFGLIAAYTHPSYGTTNIVSGTQINSGIAVRAQASGGGQNIWLASTVLGTNVITTTNSPTYNTEGGVISVPFGAPGWRTIKIVCVDGIARYYYDGVLIFSQLQTNNYLSPTVANHRYYPVIKASIYQSRSTPPYIRYRNLRVATANLPNIPI